MNAASRPNPIDGQTEPVRAWRPRPDALALLFVCGLTVPAMALSGPGGEGHPSDVRREVVRSLKISSDRLAALVRRIAEPADEDRDRNGVPVSLRIRTMQAEADYLNAKLAREVAEIEVREYEVGIRVQEESSIEVEIRLADSARVRSGYLAATARTDDQKAWTELQLQGHDLAYGAARMARSNLTHYTAPRRIKELEAKVARCRNLERVAEAAWKALQAGEARIAKAVADHPAESTSRRLGPAAVARAVTLQEQIQSRLAGYAKGPESADLLVKELREQTNVLETLVDEAEAAVASDDLERVKPLVRAAIRRAGAAGDKR
jgi:hypothetical protein